MGSSNENSGYGPVRNPVALDRVPGGSSGGSAAAVAAGMAVATLGTDTGGSVRQPASFCGVVGVLPTYGRVSRYGLIAFASSLDRVGPVTRTVRDAATMLGVIAGHDPLDATSSRVPVPDYTGALEHPVNGLRVGVPAEYFGDGLDAEYVPPSTPPSSACELQVVLFILSRCPTPAMPYPPTTSSLPPKPAPTWLDLMAFATASALKMRIRSMPCIASHASRASGLK